MADVPTDNSLNTTKNKAAALHCCPLVLLMASALKSISNPNRTMRIKTVYLATILSSALFSFAHADDKAALMSAGKTAYNSCMACHGADGKGLNLGGGNMMAPAIAGSKYVNGDPSVLALVILKGIQKEGTDYLGMMAPMEAAIPDDEKLASVMTFVRNSFGNTAGVVTKEDATKYRAQWQAEKAAITRAKLKELSK